MPKPSFGSSWSEHSVFPSLVSYGKHPPLSRKSHFTERWRMRKEHWSKSLRNVSRSVRAFVRDWRWGIYWSRAARRWHFIWIERRSIGEHMFKQRSRSPLQHRSNDPQLTVALYPLQTDLVPFFALTFYSIVDAYIYRSRVLLPVIRLDITMHRKDHSRCKMPA